MTLWTTAVSQLPLTKTPSTIGLRVSFFFCAEDCCSQCLGVSRKVCPCRPKITPSAPTLHHSNFGADVIKRNGSACVVSLGDEPRCEAVHLTPRNKGEEVMFVVNSCNCLMTLFQVYSQRVLEPRSPRYDPPIPPSHVGIDDIVNGIFLRRICIRSLVKERSHSYGCETFIAYI